MVSLFTKKKSAVDFVTVSSELAGQRLDNFLIHTLKGLPKTRVYRLVRKGEVRVNKGRIKPNYRLAAGDIVRIPPVHDLKPSKAPKLTTTQSPLMKILEQAVLYEDESIIILNKPSGLAVHGGSGLNFGVIEAFRLLRRDCPDLELVHRLDRDTSGCLMLSKRRSTLRALHALLREAKVQKVYWALVKGLWKKAKTVTIPLMKNQLSSGERLVKASTVTLGQQAITDFKPLAHYRNNTQIPMTLMEVRPITGRTHQIRVHATESGFPIAGDLKYGDKEFNHYLGQHSHLSLTRLFLHAKALTFTLPGTDKELTVQAPLDAELAQLLEQLNVECT